jgi:1,2-diacylglycerol 3-alpha-glucosyltransferase
LEPISTLPASTARSVTYVLTDIDDTLTRDGMLEPEAYEALWRLMRAGLKVIPVTGRPAGWCDCIVRQWPIIAIVGENGAFVLHRISTGIGEYVHPSVADSDVGEKLAKVKNDVLALVPDARIARDQPYRRFDLAIDFREDPPDLGFDAAERIAAICRKHGAEAKISSIHVNTWFGAYDKLSMSRLYLERFLHESPDALASKVAFCGDSPNDEPMFRHFPVSIGVANIHDTERFFTNLPRYCTEKTHGVGFAEFADILLKKRQEALDEGRQ